MAILQPKSIITRIQDPNKIVLVQGFFSFLDFRNNNSIVIPLGDSFNCIDLYTATPQSAGIFGSIFDEAN